MKKTPSVQIDQRMTWHTEQATTLIAAGNFEAACRAYERALAYVPEPFTDLRAKILTQLSLAAFQAGQAKRATQWAEQAVRLQPSPFFLIHAHSAAGIGYASRGMFAESERHRAREYEIACTGNDQEQIDASRTHLILAQKNMGKLAEALHDCEAKPDCPSARARILRHIHSDCLLLTGRFREAREQLAIAGSGPPLPDAVMEERTQAVFKLAAGQVEAGWALSGPDDAAFHAQEAERQIRSALSYLRGDPKMGLWCEAALAWVLALRGDEPQARSLVGRIDWQLKTNATSVTFDRDTRLQCFAALGRATFLLGEHAQSLSYWRNYLETGPNPVSLPLVWYFLGENHTHLREKAAARDAFAHALTPGIDTYYARLSRERLQELDATQMTG